MSRGGRRRKGKRGRRSPGTAERRLQSGERESEAPEPQPSRRRGSGRGGTREISVLEQMATRHTTLQTLPPDGVVLEELIGALQSEYGVPTTPQEYRLIIKTRQPDEPTTDPSIEVKPESKPEASGPEVEAANEAEPDAGRPPGIRRRRRRRSGGSATSAEAAEPDAGAGDPSAAG